MKYTFVVPALFLLAACQPSSQDEINKMADAAEAAAPHGPKNAPSHDLIGIEFGKPLPMSECKKGEDLSYQVKAPCYKPGNDGLPNEIVFPLVPSSLPRFVKSEDDVRVSVNPTTHNVESLMVNIGDDDYDQSMADDALVTKFGPQTGDLTDDWYWDFADYHVTYSRDIRYRYIQMATQDAWKRETDRIEAENAADKKRL